LEVGRLPAAGKAGTFLNYGRKVRNVPVVQAGQLERAETAYREAIALAPNLAEAHNGLGNVLRRAGRNEQAIACHRAAIQLRPDFAEAHASLALACGELGRQAEATASRRRVVELRPDSASAGSDLLYDLHYDSEVSPAELFDAHLRWARKHADPLTAAARPHANDRDPDRRLRVGYVSADFRKHPVARFQEPVLANHDRAAFEVFCYSDVRRADAVTERLRSYADVWRETAGLSDAQLAEAIRADAIDVLVDLAGHAAGNRLLTFARRPTPVQVTCNGYMNTTGMSAMDYRLTDALHDPLGMTESLHTETLVRLPNCAWCYRPGEAEHEEAQHEGRARLLPSRGSPDDRGSAGASPSQLGPHASAAPPCARNGFVIFGSLNKFYKATPMVLDLWARILAQVPGSRLLLVVAGGDALNPSVRRAVVERGVPSERLEILDKASSRGAYLDRFGQIDIALDTFPFNGITTTCDALWMGVPVVSRTGPASASRAGLSLLTAVGLGELACPTPDEYVRCAVRLATDRDRLATLRRELRTRMERSPIRDERGYARAVEEAYRTMWAGWCGQGQPPCRPARDQRTTHNTPATSAWEKEGQKPLFHSHP
jgi:predicted O-linked N-acetylglucosamine transferase (SPINDLY family)